MSTGRLWPTTAGSGIYGGSPAPQGFQDRLAAWKPTGQSSALYGPPRITRIRPGGQRWHGLPGFECHPARRRSCDGGGVCTPGGPCGGGEAFGGPDGGLGLKAADLVSSFLLKAAELPRVFLTATARLLGAQPLAAHLGDRPGEQGERGNQSAADR